MERKYDATYKFGNITVYVVAPPPMAEQEKETILREYYAAAWEAWDTIPEKQRLQINAACR
ncbi:MAG: hypothetical protein ABFC57_08485 [Veillonellales bacterium]